MHIFYRLLFSLGLMVIGHPLLAQNPAYKSPEANYSPQSPNVASLGRFGAHPVNMFTGIPGISIPIYDISVGSLKIPVSLDYHAGGNKVNDMASWVGLGWSLTGGSMISRTVMGIADEGPGGILSLPLNTTLSPNSDPCPDPRNQYAHYVDGAHPDWDTSYDIFSYSLPGGKSGKFILIPDSVSGSMATLMPYERIKVTYTAVTTGVFNFTLVDEDGISYFFSTPEGVTTFSNFSNSAWHITEIRGLRPTETATFSYSISEFNGYTDFIDRMSIVTGLDVFPGGCSSVGVTSVLSTVQSNPGTYFSARLLSEIIFPGGKLKFVPETTIRADVASSATYIAAALDRIELYGLSANTNDYLKIKQFDLQQIYATVADPSLNAFLSGPLTLTALVMQDENAVEVGRYTCAYNTGTLLPGFKSRARDVWGYYNGVTTNTTLIPVTPVMYSTTTGTATQNYGSANRTASETHMQAQILTQLTYPTCGYSKFFYEANRYQDGPTTKLAGGLRIARIETQASSAEPITVKTYKYGTNSESGYGNLNADLSSYGWQTSYKEYIGQECLRTVTVLGSNYNGSLTPFDGSPVTYPYVVEYEGTYVSGSLVQNANGYTVYTFRNSTDQIVKAIAGGQEYVFSKHWDRGQLVTKLVYSKADKLVYRLLNSYTNPPIPRGSSIPNIGMFVARFLTYTDEYKGANPNRIISVCDELKGYTPPRLYDWPLGTIRLVNSYEYHYGSDGISNVVTRTNMLYNSNFQVNKKSIYAADGTIAVRQFTYPYDVTIPASPTGAVKAIKILQDTHQRNVVLEEYGYKQVNSAETNPVMTDGKLTLYKELPSNRAFPDEVHELAVLGGSTRKNSFVAMSIGGAGTVNKDGLYSKALTFTTYDGNVNPTLYTARNGITTQLDWQTLTAPNGNLHSVLTQQTGNVSTATVLSTQYSYDVPLNGLKSMIDPKGMSTKYEYDLFGRLKAIKDHYGNLEKTFDYNYGCSNYNPKKLDLILPNLVPIMYALPSTVVGTTPIGIAVEVYNLNSATSSNGVISVYINKDPKIGSVTLNPATTFVSGRVVTNGDWILDDTSDPDFYILTTTKILVTGATKVSFGLTGVLSPGSSKGSLNIGCTVSGGGEGGTTLGNNSDADTINYKNQ